MKDKFLSWVTALWLIAFAALMTFLLAWLIYPLEIQSLNLEGTTGFTADTIQANFNHLMNYLLNPWSGDLAMPNFPSSEDGLHHFKDVKNLFLFAEAVCLLLAYPALRFLRKAIKGHYLRLYHPLFSFMVLLPVLIAIMAILVGFDQFFVLFHSTFFPGDSTWLFDPAQDPIILALPETFFMHCFLIFLAVYECSFLSLFVVMRKEKGHKQGKRLH